MDRAELLNRLDSIQRDGRLRNVINLAERQRAIELLYSIERNLQIQARGTRQSELLARTRALRGDLLAIDGSLFADLTDRLQHGRLQPTETRALFRAYSSYSGQRGYEHLRPDGADTLLDGLMALKGWQPKIQAYGPHLAHYDPTPASLALELVAHVPITSAQRFMDIGSGLARNPILVHLLSGCLAYGIEIDPLLHARVVAALETLGLEQVTLLSGDARAADFSLAEVFFLYTPFTGPVLHSVLSRLERRARSGPITICTYGPCTFDVARQIWLRSNNDLIDHVLKLAIFESVF